MKNKIFNEGTHCWQALCSRQIICTPGRVLSNVHTFNISALCYCCSSCVLINYNYLKKIGSRLALKFVVISSLTVLTHFVAVC